MVWAWSVQAWLPLPRKVQRLTGKTHDWQSTDYYGYGLGEPNYPVPSIYCHTLISNRCDNRSNDITTLVMLWDRWNYY